MSEALSLEEAQTRLLALAPLLPKEQVSVQQALGRFLCDDLHAARTQPPADLSAMDGYATCGAGPWQRIGESRAGSPFTGALIPGQCVRISTGAHMPAGADRVLLQEDAQVSGTMVTSAEPPPPGRHVRKRGFDFAAGDLVLARGTKLNPARIALALAAGHRTVPTSRPPRVAILDTGDELAADPAQCETHQIPASNGAMLAAMLAPLGCHIARLGPVRDDRSAISAALAQAEDADLVITSGGASVGDHDLVQATLQDWGAQIAFWKVAIKPGKPMLVATRGHQLILGLPGNPVSCFVTGFFFALPLLRTAMGGRAALPAAVQMLTGEDLPKVGNRREFVRAVGAGNVLHQVGSQDSSALRSLAEAEFLIDRPANVPALVAGSPVSAYPLHFG